MGQQSLIYAFVARGTVVLADYTEFTGNFATIAAECLVKLPASSNIFIYNCDGHTFNYLVKDGFSYCVVAAKSVGQHMPIAFLVRIKDDFSKRYGGGKAATAVASSLNREFGSELKEHMQYCVDHPEEINKLAKVQAQVSEVKNVMMENIEKVLDSGEKIELRVDKTENLLSEVSCLNNLSAQNDIEKEAGSFVERYYKVINEDRCQIVSLYHRSCKRNHLNIEEHGTRRSTLFFDDIGGEYDPGSRVDISSFCAESVNSDLLVVVKGTSDSSHFSQTFYLSKEGSDWIILSDIICFLQNSNAESPDEVIVPSAMKIVLPGFSAENSQSVIGSAIDKTRLQSKGSNASKSNKVIDEEVKADPVYNLPPRSRKPPKHFTTEGYETNINVRSASTAPPTSLSKTCRKSESKAAVPSTKQTYTQRGLSSMSIHKAKSKVCIINHEGMLKHSAPKHKERPSRIREIMRTLKKDGLLIIRCDLLISQPADPKHILAVHDAEFLDFIPNAPLNESEAETYKDYIGEVYFSEGTRDAALLAAGSVVQGCDLVLEGCYDSAFAVVRPPGHHALPNFADGFCIFNNVAIGAKYLINKGLKKIMIVDFDVHHGNGTQNIFYDSKQVMVVSIHSSKLKYPKDSEESSNNRKVECIGANDGLGYNVNINLDSGYGDHDMFLVLQQILMPLATQFNPDFTLVSAGYDAAEGDPLGDACLTPECIATVVHMLKQVNTGRLVLSLEGGYNIKVIAKCVSFTVRALLGDPEVLVKEQDFYQKKLLATTAGVVEKVKRILRPFWDLVKWRRPGHKE